MTPSKKCQLEPKQEYEMLRREHGDYPFTATMWAMTIREISSEMDFGEMIYNRQEEM
jgi:hypothetical protein